jgi:hypothetical protein
VDTSDGSKTYSLSISEPIATLAFGPQVGIVYYESNDGVESASASAPSAIFNGSISGTTLTVNSVSSGTVTSGLVLDGPGVLAGTTIQSGGGSTFTVSNSQTIPAQTLYAGVQKHFGFAYSDGTNYVTVRQQGYNISAGNYGGGASGFAQPAYKCLPCAFNATLVGTTLIVSSIGASDPNSINSNPSINIGQQIAVGGVTLTGVTVTSQTSGTTGGVGQYVVTNPNAYNYGSSTAMTSSLQGGLAYAGQYYTPTGVGQPWDSGLFSDAISGTGESSVIIVSQQDGGKFNLNSFRFGPNPHYQTNGNCYIRVTGYTGNIPTFSGSSHPSFNQNGAVLNSDGYANNTTTSMIGVTPSGLTSIASASTAFKGVTSVVFQCYGYAIGNSVGGGPSNSPLFTIDYIITTPNANTGEVSSWSFTANGAVAESGIAADTSNGIGTYTISVAESGNASDSPASNAIFNSTTIEAGAANDLESVGYLATGVVNEVGSAAESIFSTAVFYDLISESGAAADSSSGTGLYVGTTLENGSALDSSSGAGIYGLNTQETGAASETTSPQVSFNAATVETALALDTPIVNVNFNAAVSEFGSAIDSNFPTASYGLGVAETGNASAFTSVLAPIVAAVLENGNAVDNTYQQTITIGPLVASWAASVNFATNLSLVPPANLSTAWTPSATTNFTLTALGSMAANWSTGASSILNASYAADTNDGYDDYTFRQSFPEFADINKYPYATIKMYWSMAGNMVSQASCPCNFLTGDALKLATYYMTAHLMSLALARIAAVNNGSGGTQGGFKTSATIDMITVQYLAPPATQAYEWWLVQTQYGQALWAMIDILSVGGLSIGGLPERAAFRKVGGVFV